MLTILVTLLFIFICFNGLFIRLFLDLGILELKSYVPEILIFLIMLILIIDYLKRKKFYNNFNITLWFIMLIFSKLLFDIARGATGEQIIYIVRDLLLPFLFFYIAINSYLFRKNTVKIVEKLCGISKIFIVSGLILAVMQVMLGWEFTSKLYSGYTFFGDDLLTGVRVYTNNGGLLRVPSVTGNFTLFGIMNLFALYFIYLKSIKYKEIYAVLALFNAILTTSRTAIVMIVIFLIIRLPFRKIIRLSPFILSIMLPILLLLITKMNSIFSMESFFIRIKEVWPMLTREFTKASDILIGGRLSDYGTASSLIENLDDIAGYRQWVDNTYLFMLLSFGLIGIILYMSLLYKSYLKSNRETRGLIIAISIGAIFATFFVARTMFFLYLSIALSYDYSLDKDKEG